MQSTFSRSIVVCGALFTGLLASSFSRDTRPDETPTVEEIAEASELFSSSCASCHLPPNPDYATDRAWLSQVRDTA